MRAARLASIPALLIGLVACCLPSGEPASSSGEDGAEASAPHLTLQPRRQRPEAGCEPEVRYDGQTFTATFCDQVPSTCDEGAPVWGGATLRRASDSFHHDLPAAQVEGGRVTVSGEVGPGFVQYVIGTWCDKEPCTSGRHGCEAHGYELQQPSWTQPRHAYDGQEHSFAELHPLAVQLVDAGGGAQLVGKISKQLRTSSPIRFEAIHDGGDARSPRDHVQILYRGRWDRVRAWKLASTLREAELGIRWSVEHWPEAPEAFVIAVGAP